MIGGNDGGIVHRRMISVPDYCDSQAFRIGVQEGISAAHGVVLDFIHDIQSERDQIHAQMMKIMEARPEGERWRTTEDETMLNARYGVMSLVIEFLFRTCERISDRAKCAEEKEVAT